VEREREFLFIRLLKREQRHCKKDVFEWYFENGGGGGALPSTVTKQRISKK